MSSIERSIAAYMKTAAYRSSKKAIDAYNDCVRRTGGDAKCLEILEKHQAEVEKRRS